jgi:hypothetical protein
MNDTTFDPREASGESAMRGARPLELNEISLNGDGSVKEIAPGKFERKGGFFRKRILIGKPKDVKPEEVSLGNEITLVFLKVRRRLVERAREGEIVRSIGEHNSPSDAVTLYENATKLKFNGVAKDLREKFPNLRTVQIVYALLVTPTTEPELVRFIVKGASLGSEVKAEGVMDFYEYISSFTGEDHFYQYKTVLTPVMEEGKQTYFAIKFVRGEKLSEKSYSVALERMKEVHENCVEMDTQRAQRIVSATTTDIQLEPSDTSGDLPPNMTEDIDPDSIPF